MPFYPMTVLLTMFVILVNPAKKAAKKNPNGDNGGLSFHGGSPGGGLAAANIRLEVNR